MKCTLEPYEMDLGSFIGTKRHEEAVRQRLRDCHGFEGDPLKIHIDGARGEVATAKSMNWFYNGSVNTFRDGGDVGEIQVRTRSRNDYDLIIRNNDKDEDIFVLVTGEGPEYNVRGWIRGGEGKQERYMHTYGRRPAAYFVPQDALRPMTELWKQVTLKHFETLKCSPSSTKN